MDKTTDVRLQRVRWKETMGASLKHFESGCFITEGVCTFDTRYKCREASKASFKTQARSWPVVLSTLYNYSINLIWGDHWKPTVPPLGPYEDKTIAEDEWKAPYHSNLKVLLWRTFLPVDIAYMFSVDTICFQGELIDFFWTLLPD